MEEFKEFTGRPKSQCKINEEPQSNYNYDDGLYMQGGQHNSSVGNSRLEINSVHTVENQSSTTSSSQFSQSTCSSSSFSRWSLEQQQNANGLVVQGYTHCSSQPKPLDFECVIDGLQDYVQKESSTTKPNIFIKMHASFNVKISFKNANCQKRPTVECCVIRPSARNQTSYYMLQPNESFCLENEYAFDGNLNDLVSKDKREFVKLKKREDLNVFFLHLRINGKEYDELDRQFIISSLSQTNRKTRISTSQQFSHLYPYSLCSTQIQQNCSSRQEASFASEEENIHLKQLLETTRMSLKLSEEKNESLRKGLEMIEEENELVIKDLESAEKEIKSLKNKLKNAESKQPPKEIPPPPPLLGLLNIGFYHPKQKKRRQRDHTHQIEDDNQPNNKKLKSSCSSNEYRDGGLCSQKSETDSISLETDRYHLSINSSRMRV